MFNASNRRPTNYVAPPANVIANAKATACVHPRLTPWKDSKVASSIRISPTLKCPTSLGDDWVTVIDGKINISTDALSKHGNIACVYTPIRHSGYSDFKIVLGKAVSNVSTGYSVTDDFFEMHCIAKDKTVYNQVHSTIIRQSLVEQPKKAPGEPGMSGSKPVNILIFGLDSTSRMMWLDRLKRTHDYLVDVLGAVVLEGYNIVGDGTPAALLPILTAKNETELPEARRGHAGVKPVDGHPWIWKQLNNAGYATQYGEDLPTIGTFHYRMLGFNKPPVNHYTRPFFLRMADKKLNNMCFGSIPMHVNVMNWIREFFKAYKDEPKFSFLFLSALTHDEPLKVNAAVDNDIRTFLRKLNEGGYLDNTLVILMADHGARFSKLRKSVQGKMEERMPYMAVRLPPSFTKKYASALKNLKTNAHRLTTPFDIHETLVHAVNYETMKVDGLVKQRGLSLLNKVPLQRTCKDAYIALHWCACLKWTKVGLNDKRVLAAAKETVKLINEMTSGHRSLCTALTMSSVVSAESSVPHDELLRFLKSSDDDGYEANLNDKMKAEEVHYQISLMTSTSSATYEATVRYNVRSGAFSLSLNEISRTDRYGDQPHCVASEHPHLRQFCYCKVQL